MPTLNWIGKQAVENHDKEIPYKLIKCEETVGDKETGNLIVQGDNLEALKALLPYYAGQVKCIYIDPPYNTGNEGWAYNDNVNSPEIKEWLHKVVGKEGEDLSRHDKWLCMMYPRLKLLREFLKDDGVIFINIDENEISNLGQICDEIFNRNRIGIYIWASRSGRGGTVKNLAVQHEYIYAYARNVDKINLKPETRVSSGGNYNDDKGNYKREQLRQWGQGDKRADRPSMFFPIIFEGKEILPIKPDGAEGRWRFGKKSVMKMLAENDLEFDEEEGVVNVYRKIRSGKITETAQGTLLLGLGSASTGTKELKEIFGYKAFPTVKPTALIKYLLDLVTYDNENSLMLDSFSGSGTTAHSVLQLNKEDGGNRKFILIEMDEKICKEVTTERVKRVINGYEVTKTNGTKEKVEGLGGGFKYCKLGEPLFDEFGNIREDVKFNDLAHHVFFSETGVPLDSRFRGNDKNNLGIGAFIGEYKGIGYYLLFNGILGDKSINGGNVLTSKVLDKLPKYKGRKIIFGEGCRLGAQRLRKENITFKQIPYEIRIS